MIEVGEYVKCKNGRIAKVENIEKDFIYFDAEIYRQNGIPMNECETCFSEFIVKHSKNIIDLIEVGDIVKIEREKLGNSTHIIETKFGLNMLKEDLNKFKDEHIKSIVTSEQFKSIEYRLED